MAQLIRTGAIVGLFAAGALATVAAGVQRSASLAHLAMAAFAFAWLFFCASLVQRRRRGADQR